MVARLGKVLGARGLTSAASNFCLRRRRLPQGRADCGAVRGSALEPYNGIVWRAMVSLTVLGCVLVVSTQPAMASSSSKVAERMAAFAGSGSALQKTTPRATAPNVAAVTIPVSAESALGATAIQSATSSCGQARQTLFHKLSCWYDALGKVKTAIQCTGDILAWGFQPLKLLKHAKSLAEIISAAKAIKLNKVTPSLRAAYSAYKSMVARLAAFRNAYGVRRTNALVKLITKQSSYLDVAKASVAWAKLMLDNLSHKQARQFTADVLDFIGALADVAGVRSCYDLIRETVENKVPGGGPTACTATALIACGGGTSGSGGSSGGGSSGGGSGGLGSGSGGLGGGGPGCSTSSGSVRPGEDRFPSSLCVTVDGHLENELPYSVDVTVFLTRVASETACAEAEYTENIQYECKYVATEIGGTVTGLLSGLSYTPGPEGECAVAAWLESESERERSFGYGAPTAFLTAYIYNGVLTIAGPILDLGGSWQQGDEECHAGLMLHPPGVVEMAFGRATTIPTLESATSASPFSGSSEITWNW